MRKMDRLTGIYMGTCGWLLLAVVILLGGGCAQTEKDGGEAAQEAVEVELPAIHEVHTLADAKTLAAELNKPILVDFFADWCGPCKRFTKEKEEDADLRRALGGVVFVSIDCEKGEGVDHASTYSVHVYPSFVLINAAGETIARWAGYGKDGFIADLEQALSDLTPITGKRDRFEQNPTVSDAAALGSYHNALGEAAEAVSYYRQAQSMNQDPERDYSFSIFRNISQGMRNETFTPADLKQAADGVMEQGRNAEEVLWVAMMMHQRALGQGDTEASVFYLNSALARTEGETSESVQAQREELVAEHALYVLKDEAKAIVCKKETLSADWQQSDSELNSFAWWCFERGINLEEAEEMAQKGVDIASPGRSKAMLLDTLADICSARGNHADAISAIQQAIEQEADNQYYTNQLAKFQQRLGGDE